MILPFGNMFYQNPKNHSKSKHRLQDQNYMTPRNLFISKSKAKPQTVLHAHNTHLSLSYSPVIFEHWGKQNQLSCKQAYYGCLLFRYQPVFTTGLSFIISCEQRISQNCILISPTYWYFLLHTSKEAGRSWSQIQLGNAQKFI